MEYTLKQNHETLSSHVSNDPIGWFEEMAENAVAVQTQTLRRILEQNLRTEYLQKWLGEEVRVQDLGDSEMESLYRKSVPLATHADFEPFIQRIADGETNPILTQKPITCLSLTSGTTEGRQKYVPFNMDCVNVRRTSLLVDLAFRSRVYPIKEGGKVLSFMYCNTKLPKTKGGLKVGSVSTLFLSCLAKAKKLSAECSPWEIASMGEHKQLTYCHLLLGLFFSEKIEFIISNFAHTMVDAFASFESIWKDLCHDLSEGTLSPIVECRKMRKIVLKIINVSPNPSLASEIEDKCRELEGSDWSGLIPKLWPNAKYVRCITTGTMKHYAKKLRHYLGDLPMVCSWFVSSEGLIGLNANPSVEPVCVSFSVVPYASYFEFIPLHKEKLVTSGVSVGDSYTEDEPIPLSQTKVGQEYEIVLTTFTGLYRYRLGDVVEVVGFHKNTPRLKFICRSKVCLSINIGKTTEKDLEIVAEQGSELLSKKTNAEMVDYTSHANVENQPGHYIIYWEIKGDHDDENTNVVLQECCTEMDKLFGDICYIVSRRSNDIGPLELCIVEREAFKRVFDCFVENGGNVGQYKTPRCTNNQAILGVLKDCIVKRFHSTAYGN